MAYPVSLSESIHSHWADLLSPRNRIYSQLLGLAIEVVVPKECYDLQQKSSQSDWWMPSKQGDPENTNLDLAPE